MEQSFVDTSRLQFKTPFFRLEVGETGQSLSALPQLIHQLVDSLQITQTVGKGCDKIMATISFIEGSREPFNTLDADTGSLYQLGTSSTNVLTNATGMLADLKFSSGGGLTQVSKADILASVGAVKNALSALNSKSVELFAPNFSKVESPKYVFKQGNFIKVTWGYKETEIQASFLGEIKIVQYEFSDNDHPKLTITVESLGTTLEQVSAFTGTPFFNKVPSGTDEAGQPTYRFEGTTSVDILKKLASDAGMDLIISDSLEASSLEKDKNFVWPAGMKMSQILSMLAQRHGAIFLVTYHPVTAKPTLIFTKFADFYGTEILPKQMFVWKGKDSIIKNLAVRVDYGTLSGAGVTGVADDGTSVKAAAEQPVSLLIAEGKGQIDTKSSTDKNGIKDIKNNVAGGKQLAHVQYSPAEVNTPANAKSIADTSSQCAISNALAVEMTTLGHPSLRPGTIKISNISQRYSGPYYIKVCVHNINNEGYTCQITATGNMTQDGYASNDTQKLKEDNEGTVDILLSVPKLPGVSSSSSELNSKINEAIKGK